MGAQQQTIPGADDGQTGAGVSAEVRDLIARANREFSAGPGGLACGRGRDGARGHHMQAAAQRQHIELPAGPQTELEAYVLEDADSRRRPDGRGAFLAAR